MAITTSTSYNLVNNTQLPREHTVEQNNVSASTSTSDAQKMDENAQKVEKIFEARAPIRNKTRTDNTIKTIVCITVALLGLGAIIAGTIFGAAVVLPIGAAIILVFLGHVAALSAVIAHPTKRVVTEKEEKQFWKAISTDSLSELTSKRWHGYCSDAPYYGDIEGVCKIAYQDLQDLGMKPESARKLKTLLDRSQMLKDLEAHRVYYDSNLKEIRVKNIPSEKLRLQAEFEAFRNAFIQETYQNICI